jgi:hypothetical protein
VAATAVPLTFFEVSAVLAFLAFAEAKVDVAILETGLGGRLDATSVCHPVACAITSIALDHEAILGNTLPPLPTKRPASPSPGFRFFSGRLPARPTSASPRWRGPSARPSCVPASTIRPRRPRQHCPAAPAGQRGAGGGDFPASGPGPGPAAG